METTSVEILTTTFSQQSGHMYRFWAYNVEIWAACHVLRDAHTDKIDTEGPSTSDTALKRYETILPQFLCYHPDSETMHELSFDQAPNYGTVETA